MSYNSDIVVLFFFGLCIFIRGQVGSHDFFIQFFVVLGVFLELFLLFGILIHGVLIKGKSVYVFYVCRFVRFELCVFVGFFESLCMGVRQSVMIGW